MHGLEGEVRKRRKWHMWPVPALATVEDSSASNSFCKDGRKISVGDCALFQAPNSPPFIGIIRWLQSGKEENNSTLGVNWLYRPADVKLGKGILLEAAPNEVFYSFHKDEISAASLLHPCKVAFLRKGVELPSGISSFVCRRVYDIENKCLWWLTDQDYINERQEEVDQLLDKTRLEMHAGLQSGGRSPKPLNGPNSAQQLKPGADSVPNSSITSFPSQVKGKKRERGDQGAEPIKRERTSKADDGDSGHFRPDNMTKIDIAKIIDKEGSVNSESVEKLVNLMQLDRSEKKIDFAGRTMLADLIAATDSSDSLVRLLRGLPVLDDWLQEAHKGKIGDGSSPKESDKVIEELLISLLRALDKLPVNLHALQSCNIGKSVNHLRSHKNLEIQKKARSLVDTWKKRVDQEMKNNDAKSGSCTPVSWPGKSGFSDGGNRRGGSSDFMKSSATQSTVTKTISSKVGHGDTVTKSISSPGSVKSLSPSSASMTINSKDSQCKTMVGSGGASDLPLATIKEEKSSSSSQSQNNSQSCSSDHAKTAGSAWKEDARSSTAGSMSAKTTPGGGSRHRKSSNGFLGSGVSVIQKESPAGKSGSLNRNAPSDKVSQSGLACEKSVDTLGDHGGGRGLIVRLPNPGRSPAQSISGGSLDDPAVVVSRASSPGVSEKDHHDRKMKVKNEPSQSNNIAADVNRESWQSNDVKDGLAGSDEGCDRSPAAVLDEERGRNSEENGKAPDVTKATCSSSGNEKKGFLSETKPGRIYDVSFSSMNALVESCVAEATASLSVGDDLGMNLLASVAAGEMSKSDLVSPNSSPQRNSALQEDCCVNNDVKPRSSRENAANQCAQPDDAADDKGNGVSSSRVREGLQQICDTVNFSGECKNALPSSLEHKSMGVKSEKSIASGMELHQVPELCLKSEDKHEEPVADGCKAASIVLTSKENSAIGKKEPECEVLTLAHMRRKVCSSGENDGCLPDSKIKARNLALDEKKASNNGCENIPETSEFVRGSLSDKCQIDKAVRSNKAERDAIEESLPCSSPVTDSETKIAGEDLSAVISIEEERPVTSTTHVDIFSSGAEDSVALPPHSTDVLSPADLDKSKIEKAESLDAINPSEQNGSEQMEPTSHLSIVLEDQFGGSLVIAPDKSNDVKEDKEERKDAIEQPCEEEINQESDTCAKSTGSKLPIAEADESAAEASCSTIAAGSDPAAKLDFDLNEGFLVDEGNQSDPVTGTSSLLHLPSSCLPISVPSVSNSLSAPITVAAAAKGSFVPPETPLKSEERWKGSAATSAFRPAEPRKVLEMPLVHLDVAICETAFGKQGRPPLDIDLNVPDERVLEDMLSQSSTRGMGSEAGSISNHDLSRGEMFASPAPSRATGGLGLDLNRVDEGLENCQFLANTTRRLETSHLAARSSSSGGLPNGEAHALRDFDLNNGPVLDEMGSEPAHRNQHSKSNMPYLPPLAGLRMNNAELGSLSPWFPPGNSYSAVSIPSFLPDRGDQPYPIIATAGAHRILGSAAGGTFGGDLYRGPVLSSSPAMAFSSATAFQYAGFPFGTNFPLASTSFSGGSTPYMDTSSAGGACFPAVPSQLVGPAGAVLSPYGRPYPINLPEGPGGGSESNRKWGRQGLDLNAGPGSVDMEGRDERSSATTRQLSVPNSQAFVEDPARIYQAAAASGVLKRKEPEGGWDADRFGYKQSSWQ